jgi:hypothetical protein
LRGNLRLSGKWDIRITLARLSQIIALDFFLQCHDNDNRNDLQENNALEVFNYEKPQTATSNCSPKNAQRQTKEANYWDRLAKDQP